MIGYHREGKTDLLGALSAVDQLLRRLFLAAKFVTDLNHGLPPQKMKARDTATARRMSNRRCPTLNSKQNATVLLSEARKNIPRFGQTSGCERKRGTKKLIDDGALIIEN
jgi:hypothetical protein